MTLLFAGLISMSPCQQCLDQSWQTGKWTESDKEFKVARKKLEVLASDKGKLDVALADYTRQVNSSKPTALSLYCWAYAAILRSRGDFDYATKFNMSSKLKEPYKRFTSLSRPNSFEFTRVRWMFVVSFEFPHQNLIPIGEKIGARDRSDSSIALYLISLYQPQLGDEQREKGIKLVKHVDALLPNNSRALSATSYFYYLSWRHTRSASDAKEVTDRLSKAYKLSASEAQKKLMQKVLDEVKSGKPRLPL